MGSQFYDQVTLPRTVSVFLIVIWFFQLGMFARQFEHVQECTYRRLALKCAKFLRYDTQWFAQLPF